MTVIVKFIKTELKSQYFKEIPQNSALQFLVVKVFRLAAVIDMRIRPHRYASRAD